MFERIIEWFEREPLKRAKPAHYMQYPWGALDYREVARIFHGVFHAQREKVNPFGWHWVRVVIVVLLAVAALAAAVKIF